MNHIQSNIRLRNNLLCIKTRMMVSLKINTTDLKRLIWDRVILLIEHILNVMKIHVFLNCLHKSSVLLIEYDLETFFPFMTKEKNKYMQHI